MNENRYLISIAIGPVQTFIAAARKLRDLWYGSTLLSELSKAVARSLADQGCELIFPAPENESELKENSELNVSNKIIAISPSGADPNEIVKKAEKQCRELWKKLAEKALDEFPSGTVNEELYWKQIDDFGEFYAAWDLYQPDEYKKSLKSVEDLLAARKLLRNFEKPNWDGAGLLKSSLDGGYETVLINRRDDRRLQQRHLVKNNEQLDAVGNIKRGGGRSRTGNFESLSDIAISSYLDGLNAGMTAKIEDTIKIIREVTDTPAAREFLKDRPGRIFGKLPCEFLYRSRLERELGNTAVAEIPGLSKSIIELIKCTAEPDPYACIFVGDGDKMGKTIDGLKSKEEHRQFSQELERFSREVEEVVVEYQGELIFSGGDDVLAFFPLHRVLEGAVKINQLFAEIVGRSCENKNINIPTFSAGIAIVHHQEPLDRALKIAREAEHRAKEEGGRDALCVIQAKRSGGERSIFGKWNQGGSSLDLPAKLSTFVNWHKEGELPSTLGYQLLMTARECGTDLEWQDSDGKILPGNTTATEAIRIILHKESLDTPEAINILKSFRNLEELSSEMIIAHQLANAGRLAEGTWKKEEKKQ